MNPWNLPIGSPESRAAARAMFKSLMCGAHTIQLLGRFLGQDESALIIGPWYPLTGGGFWRAIPIPSGTGKEALKRLLATP
ncbi:MAG: hypothetical protein WCA98_03155 [Candidatus Acidiferrales bacterium]